MAYKKLRIKSSTHDIYLFIEGWAIYYLSNNWHQYPQITDWVGQYSQQTWWYRKQTPTMQIVIGNGYLITDLKFVELLLGKHYAAVSRFREQKLTVGRLEEWYQYNGVLPHIIWK